MDNMVLLSINTYFIFEQIYIPKTIVFGTLKLAVCFGTRFWDDYFKKKSKIVRKNGYGELTWWF